MKNTTIYGVGALVIIAGAGFLYFKNKKAASLLETALPSNAGTSTIATTSPTKPPLSSTINPSASLTALDLNIAALPGATTLAEIQPLIQQQQIANAQAEIEKQHQAESLAQQIQNTSGSLNFWCERKQGSFASIGSATIGSKTQCNITKDQIETMKAQLAKLGYYYQAGQAIKL